MLASSTDRSVVSSEWLPEDEIKSQCSVCMEFKPSACFATQHNVDCTHAERTVCDDCVYEYVRHTCNSGSDIYCPECSAPFLHAAVQSILYQYGDTALYERYATFELTKALEQNPEFIWCAHGCGSGQLSEGGTMNTSVQCISCHKLMCFTHRCPWHEGMTCEEYDMPRADGQVHANERWIDVNAKKCPKCHSPIQKNDGCDHMTCFKCKYEFCWECMAPYERIKRRGAYLHTRKCRHYPAVDTRNIFKRFIDLF